MPLTLKNFETHINAKIVDRGEDYFLDGLVHNFERGDKPKFQFPLTFPFLYFMRLTKFQTNIPPTNG